MKKTTIIALLISLCLGTVTTNAQKRDLDNFRSPDKNGINVFEAPKDTATTFDGVQVRIGGAFALQFQNIAHENGGAVPLYDIGNNFNLATANLDLDVALYDGVNLHLRTYLSSRHHPEPYVKGGYITINKLDFIEKGFLKDVMDKVTLKFGHMENNYGDAHFRRTDNALAIYNPFVGNYIMDAFTTEVGAEVYYRDRGWLAMVGVTNGRLNQDAKGGTSPSTLLKLGYDKQVNQDLRLRLTGSMYHTAQSGNVYLYSADRAGSRYYYVMEGVDATSKGNFRSGRFDPGFTNEMTAFMINPFVKYQGLEFFGLVETVSGKTDAETDRRNTLQLGGELLYRFGADENFYVGGRYNTVDGELASGEDVTIDRFNLGAGYFMTKNILVKLEYVNQQYDGYYTDNILNEGKFNGFVAEAVISF
ncbi:hypothetical protein [Sinomicrobium soli]|uniref:hypothetical protein n=1 Tax=Sinomicrobium sp. N-1-3-6 TaxID=2219864 RepID=UPI000DCB08ED|nr:hypothetical protein [Sinomicrobium sp. N-1-3-6]RAV29064.1 hypothetical protein DN748_09050 [Sinomicrobium sp. N-1-3-6]